MLARRVWLGLVAVSVVLGACDRHRGLTVTHAPDAAPTPAGIPIDQLIATYLAANCQWLVRCNLWPSMEACEADLLPSYVANLQNRIAAAGAGRTHYDPAAASACVAAVITEACTLSASEPVRATCAGVFAGTVPAGGSCVDNGECASHVCGNYPSDTCCAVGACLPTVSPGASCSAGDHCADGYTCDGYQGGRPGTCQPLRAEGEPCSTSTQCQPTLECDREGTGTCVPLVGIGEACTNRAASCDPILGFCDPASGTCQPRLPVGAPCDATITDANGGCVHHASCAHGVCVEQPGIGEPCSAPDAGDSRAVCRNGRCAGGTCQVTSCAVCP